MGKCPGCGYDNAPLQPCDACGGYEQQAITAYLAEVPLPEGWREEPIKFSGISYIEDVEGIGPVQRVVTSDIGTHILTMPRHWGPVPQAVLVRAAVQCHRLREGQ